jgi:hypothetical protein
LLDWYRALLDRGGEAAYHETDKPENVAFYCRRGFEVVGEMRVLGVRTWGLKRLAGRPEVDD